MPKKSIHSLLTETEQILMNILWALKEATVRQILERLPSERSMAYTSASTIVRILESKKLVKSRKEGKTHIYTPILQKEDFENHALDHLISNVFASTPTNLVRRLISDGKMSDEERQAIKKIIREEF